jgi:long-chain acyl-CoA synthetase
MVTTLPAIFFEQAQRRPDALALRHKEKGIWRRVSWSEYATKVEAVAAALLAFGLRKGESVAILGENRPEWLYCHLGAMAAGGATCGIYATCSAEQIEYLLGHSEARVLFLENEEQLEKVLEVLPRTRIERAVIWDSKGLWGFVDPRVSFFEAFLAEGRAGAALPEAGPDDTAMIIYTSGTTGPPKGAMLSHANIAAISSALLAFYPLTEDDETLSCLPFAHVYENLISVFQAIRVGYVVNFVERPETLFQNLREVSPTYFAHVPRLWEKLASSVELRMADSTFVKRAAYRAALGIARRRIRAERASLALAAAHRIAEWLVLRPLRWQLGLDRVRLAICGAAPASPELFEFYRALGLPLVEGYGQTESSGAIAIDRLESRKPGSVGEPLPGIEVTLAEDGEILTRGAHVFKGYFKDPELTARTIDEDGFLHTGDLGAWDGARLCIVDRKKDIIVTAGGKNITPAYIENKLKFSPYIQDAVVVGDRRKFIIALILIDEDNVTRFAQDLRIPFGTFADLTREPEVLKLVGREVDKVNRTLSQVESVKKFALLPRRLYEEDGDVTPTRKVKRRSIEARYAELITSLYGD